MSDIRGEGWGSEHDWRHDLTDVFSRTITGPHGALVGTDMGTRYICRGCSSVFVHMYNWVPDIFVAMKGAGVTEHCAGAP